MKIRRKILAGLLSVAMITQSISPSAALAAGSADEGENTVVLADFQFDSMNSSQDGFDGGNAAASISGGEISLEEHEDGNAVHIGSGSCLNITAADGSSLLTGWDAVTISFDVKPEASMSWIYFGAPDTSAQSYGKEKYIGFLKSAGSGNFTIERYNNTSGRPGNNLTGSLTNGEWNHVEVEYTETETTVRVDGNEVASSSSSYLLSDILKDQSVLQIGKANWGSGEYSNMSLDNLKITASLGESITTGKTLDLTEGKSRTLTVSGISRYANADISFESDNTAVAVVDNGTVTGVAAGTANIITTVSYGGAVKKLTTEVTVTASEPAELRPVVSLDFDDESIGDATAVMKNWAAYTGDIAYAEGRSGKAIQLNGYGLRLNQKNTGTNYTVSMWMKHDSVLGENQQILLLGRGDSSAENWLDIGGDRGTGKTYEIWTRNTTSGSEISGWNYLDEDTLQITGKWTMLTVTGNGTDFCVYLNGQLLELNGSGKTDASIRNAANILNGEEQDIYVGVNYWDTAFSGLVDDVAVYDQELSEDEILALYEQQYAECVAQHLDLGDLTAVSENLNLPLSDADSKATITWESDNQEILANDGTVTRPQTDEDAVVTLTATVAYGAAKVTRVFTVTVKKADTSGDLQEAADALNLCSVTAEDLKLPAQGSKNTSITWSSSNTDVMTDDGKIVSRPAVGEGNAAVTLTAVLSKDGGEITKTFEVEVLEEYYGYIYGYITGDNDRTGSLHLAYSTDGKNYTALNSNSGIHFAEIDTGNTSKNLSTGLRFTEIGLFRKADGTFGLAAPQGKDQKQVYFYDSEDLITYSNERLLAANTDIGNVSDVAVRYDAAIGGYYLYWTNGGQQYANVTTDLMTLGTAQEAEYTVSDINAETVPEGAKNGSAIGVTKAEYQAIIDHFAMISYESTEQPEAVTVKTAADIRDALPETVSVSYDDGSSSAMNVAWDVDTPDFSRAGTYTVTGTLSSYDNPLIEERADPQIVYDETGECYYFTASYPAYGNVNSGYDRITLRKADSISGLSDDDTEITIWTAPSSGKMAKHVWAPELHKINGRWYVFFAAGNSDNIWAIRPYVLVCQGDDPYNAENWVTADGTAEIHAATSEDSSCFDSMSLDMTYFTDQDADGTTHHYVIWAELSPSSLYMQEIDPEQPWAGTGEVILLTAPEYGWERDSELVNEGPSILKHDGKIFCTFSASGTGPEYCIGLLYADEDADLMDPDSWTKLSYPVLTSDDVPGEYGPGHNSFTVDAYGNPVFVYHARSEKCYQNQCDYADSDPLYDPCRHARVKNVHWSKDGLPILNMSAGDELPESAKTITIQVTVEEDSVVLRDLDEAVISGVSDTVETGEQICPEISVKWGTTSLEEGTDYTVTYGENTAAGEGSVTITAVEGSRYTGSKTVAFRILASVIADFDFDDETDGFTGGNAVAEKNGSIELTDNGDGKAAKFTAGDQDWLNVTASDGSSLLTGYDEITISYDILPETSGTHWVLYAAPDDTMLSWGTNGNKERYLGVLVKNGVTEIERYKNSGSRPAKPTITMKAGEWQHVDIVYTKDGTVAYLDGQRVSKVDTGYQLTDILGTDSIFQIGKANWSPGEYSTMQLDNFRIVAGTKLYEEDKLNQAKSEIAEKLGDITKVTDDLELLTETSDGLTVTWSSDRTDIIAEDGTVTIPAEENQTVILTAVIRDGEETVAEEKYTVTVLAKGNTLEKIADELSLPYSTEEGREVYGNITLPETVNGKAEVTWTTDHPEIVDTASHEVAGYDDMPAGTVTRPAKDTDVTMTARITLDEQSVERTFTFTVKAAPEKIKESDYTDYFFAYFAGEGYADGEQIYFASSQDGLNWSDLNNNNPVLTSDLGEKGVRDPFIIRSPEGDRFYLIATDLKIYGGNGWTAAQEAGSQCLMVWESTDLVNWSEQRMVEISADIEAGCTWAPEASYDPITGEYVVYWSSKVAADGYAKQRVYYAKTRDFYTFTEPQVYIEKDQSSIDTTMIENDGTYYRYTKNEGGSTNELGALTKTIFVEKSDSVLGEFTQIQSDSLNSNQYVEGPTIFKLNADDAEEDTWCLLVDDFGGIGYYPLLTTDLESGEFTSPESGTYHMPSRARHGTPLRITAEEYEALMTAYGAPEKVTAVTTTGKTPELPETVTFKMGSDKTVEKEVTWNLEGVSFDVDPFVWVTVTGTVKGSSVQAEAGVQVIPENVEYLIDCNNPDSETLKNVLSQNSGLLNADTADQAKTDDNTWGYTSTVGATNNDGNDMVGYSQSSTTNPYTGGWWAETGKNITYQVTLPAGEHTIMLGCTGWWSMDRPMDVYYSVNGGEETKLCDFDAVKSTEIYSRGVINLEEKSVVTLTVKKSGSGDPILSWIAVCGIPEEPSHTELAIVENPTDVKGKAGETAVFRVAAEGDGLSYQWQYCNASSSIWRDSSMEGSRTEQLSVPITKARNGQKYRCIVTDETGDSLISETAAIIIAAAEAPRIISQPDDCTGAVGSIAKFTVKATGSGKLSYQWQYCNASSSIWRNSSMEGADTETISVPVTKARDGQKYRCVITGESGESVTTAVVYLFVGTADDAPVITVQPEDYEGAAGMTAVFTVQASGTALTYQWQYCNAFSTVWRNSSMEGNDTATVSVPVTNFRNGQKYRCVVTDGTGNTVISDAAVLTVAAD